MMLSLMKLTTLNNFFSNTVKHLNIEEINDFANNVEKEIDRILKV